MGLVGDEEWLFQTWLMSLISKPGPLPSLSRRRACEGKSFGRCVVEMLEAKKQVEVPVIVPKACTGLMW